MQTQDQSEYNKLRENFLEVLVMDYHNICSRAREQIALFSIEISFI